MTVTNLQFVRSLVCLFFVIISLQAVKTCLAQDDFVSAVPTVGEAIAKEDKILLTLVRPKTKSFEVKVPYISKEIDHHRLRIPKQKIVEQSYTVSVPYLETKKIDGKEVTVTKTRTETRTRKVPVTYMDPNEKLPMADVHRTRIETRQLEVPGQLVKKTIEIPRQDLIVRSIDGLKIEVTKAFSLFETKTPVLVLPRGTQLFPTFKQLVKPDTLIIEQPEMTDEKSDSAKKTSEPTSQKKSE